MMNENKTISNTVCESQSKSSQVQEKLLQTLNQQSFYEVLDYVREMVEIECFDEKDKQFAEAIANIIAEVMLLPDDAPIRISGFEHSAKMVALIYLNIKHEHVEGVISRFRQAEYKIKHLKTYIRTALYNSFFESEADSENFLSRFIRR